MLHSTCLFFFTLSSFRYYLIIMSLMQDLMTRALTDLGVESFLENVFLMLSGELKQCRLVCREWDSFIMSLWGRRKGKMLTKLNYNWSLGKPCSESEIVFEGGGGKVVRMVADDQILVVIMDSNKISVISCAVLEIVAIIRDFEHRDGYTVFDLEVVLDQSCILVSGHDPSTNEVMIELFNKEGQTVLCEKIIQEEVFWASKVSFSGMMLVILIRSRVLVYKVEDVTEYEDDVARKHLVLMYKIKKISGVVTVVKVVGDNFITGDVGGKIKVWDLERGEKLRTLKTKYAIQDLAVYGEYLVTVGGINGGMGVTFWDYYALVKVKTFYDEFQNPEDSSFSRVVVRGNMLLLDGYNHAIVFGLFYGGWEVVEVAKISGHVLALNTTCIFKAKYRDFDDQIIVKDFWNEQVNMWSIFPVGY